MKWTRPPLHLSGYFAQDIDIHHPAMLRPRLGPHLDDLITDLGKWPLAYDLLFHTDIATPPDVQAFGWQGLKRTGAIQHHNRSIYTRWPSLIPQLATRSDNKWCANVVDGNRMRCRQRLK